MTTDELYWKFFSASAGIGIGSSPSAWGSLVPRQLFSGNWSSLSVVAYNRPSVLKGFWCRVNADLVIHGATDPKASVVIEGQPAAVRKDGTFSLRLAMPDGSQTVTIEITSPDGQHTKTITPIVTLAWSGSLTPDVQKPSPPRAEQRPDPRDHRQGAV